MDTYMSFYNYSQKYKENFSYIWYSEQWKIYDNLDCMYKTNRKRVEAILNFCENGVKGFYEDKYFFSKDSHEVIDFRFNGRCHIVNEKNERGLGYYTMLDNQILVKFIYYVHPDLDTEGEEPTVHTLTAQRHPENDNFIT